MNDNNIDWPTLIAQLSQPFEPHQVQWRAGATNKDKTKAIALAYAEPRTYEDRLNTICPGHWHLNFQPWGDNRIICHLTIHNITRSSTGEAGDTNPNNAGTTAEAQAFKRACSKYGLGRYLYDLPTTWVTYNSTTKQLTETPTLNNQLTHGQTVKKSNGNPSKGESAEIGPHRGQEFQKQLETLGIPTADQLNYASKLLGKNITNLGELNEAEARTLWQAARIMAPRAKAA